jgi:hypothetical protein
MARMRSSLVAMTATLAALAAPTAASAATTDCDGLQAALDAANAGDVVTLSDPGTCFGHWNLPSTPITLEGGPGAATLSGDGGDQILSGSDVGTTTIRGLTFVDGDTGGSGAAVRLVGDSPATIQDNHFFGNRATDGDGGAVSLVLDNDNRVARGAAPPVVLRDNEFGDDEAANRASGNGGAVFVSSFFRDVVVDGNRFTGNDAANGGGLYVDAARTLDLAGNRFAGNTGGGSGGGAYVDNTCTVDVTGNVFTGNHLEGVETTLQGGGLFVTAGQACDGARLTQSGNRFSSNTLDGRSGAGAGEAVIDLAVQTTSDRFVGNKIGASDSAWGGGFAYAGFGSGDFAARNLVAKGNSAVGAGQVPERGIPSRDGFGGGLYFIGFSLVASIEDSTLVGNEASDGSAVYGAQGAVRQLPRPRGIRPSGSLQLYNSIVYGNTGSDDEIGGFADAARDIRASDVCDGTAPAADGDGAAPNSNLCADPRLVATGGDESRVDQPAGGPTIDNGDSSLVDRDLARDYAGDARIAGARVDMGADEAKAAAPSPAPAAEQPAPAAGGVAGAKQRSCTSRRAFRIRIRVPHGKKALSAVVRVNGKRVKVVRGKRLRAPVRLKGLPKGTFKVKITLRLANGRKLTGTRTYHTCIPKLPGDGPPKL